MENASKRVRGDKIMPFLTCSICNRPFRDATTIVECMHTFCKKCIEDMLGEEEVRRCPVCDTDLGTHPLQKLRPDHQVQHMTDSILASARRSIPVTSAKPNEQRSTVQPQKPKRCRKKKDCGSSARVPITISDDSSNDAVKNKLLTIPEADPCRSKGKNPIVEKMQNLTVSENFEPIITQSRREMNKHVNEQMGKKAIDSGSPKPNPIWFRLFASDVQEGNPPLPQIPLRYLCVTSPGLSVSHIKKYIVHKLGLKSENEVEISLLGMTLPSDFILQDLLDDSLDEPDNKVKFNVKVGRSASGLVICLYYGRKAHPRK